MHKRFDFIKDSIALGVVGGFLGIVVMSLSNFIIYKAGKTEILYGHIAGSILMKPFRTKQRKNFILGMMFHILNGSSAGILMVQIFKKFGTDFALLKGTILGVFSFEAIYTLGQRLKIYRTNPHLTKTAYSAFWNNFLFGVITAYSIRWLAHPSVFLAIEQNEKQPDLTTKIDENISFAEDRPAASRLMSHSRELDGTLTI